MRGARQVGKTSVIRKFASEHFTKLAEINLENRKQRQLFRGVIDLADFFQRLELHLGYKVQAGKNLLFIDEAQESKEVLELLRFFVEEKPDLHVVAAGSLLEAKMFGQWKVPVGRVEYMRLQPLTFFEYCQVVGEAQWREYLENLTLGEEVVGQDIIEGLFRDYVLVGACQKQWRFTPKTKTFIMLTWARVAIGVVKCERRLIS